MKAANIISLRHRSNSERCDLRFEPWKPVFVQREEYKVYMIDL